MNRFDSPYSVQIKKIVQETPLVRSYFFDFPFRAQPGQFVMVWVPGVDEKPMSIAFDDGEQYMLSIAAVGKATQEISSKEVGGFLGIRGPYGKSFTWNPHEKIAMLAGGYGAGPLYFAATLAVKEGCHVDFFSGARNADLLLFAKYLKKIKGVNFLPSTDDGSAGFKGHNVALWIKQMEEDVTYDRVFTCGPELMMKKVSDVAHEKKLHAQISIERYMKCGFGICGNCCVDDSGIALCQKGPVMSNEEVRKIKEFGVYHRDNLGKKLFY